MCGNMWLSFFLTLYYFLKSWWEKIKCEVLNKELCSIQAATVLHHLLFYQKKNQILIEILSPDSARKHPMPPPLKSYVR